MSDLIYDILDTWAGILILAAPITIVTALAVFV